MIFADQKATAAILNLIKRTCIGKKVNEDDTQSRELSRRENIGIADLDDDWPREYGVKGSILSQKNPDLSKLLVQLFRCWFEFSRSDRLDSYMNFLREDCGWSSRKTS